MLAWWIEWPLLVISLYGFYRGEQRWIPPILDQLKAPAEGSLKGSIVHCLYWIVAAVVFNLIVWLLSGSASVAEAWTSGYVLEYTLSLDNLFIFQMLFRMYRTPAEQVDKALVFGIGAAAVLRLVFFILGTSLFEWISWIRLPFGLLLLWTAYKTAYTVSDHGAMSPIVGRSKILEFSEEYLPFVARYDRNGKFLQFNDSNDLMESIHSRQITPPSTPPTTERDSGERPPADFLKLRLTMLAAVVVALALIDVLFAMDAVAAKVTQTHDLYVNFTSSLFAMTGFRSLYFVLAEMTLAFRYLKYGVALVLAYVAVELMLSIWIAIAGHVSCFIILSICGLSIAASLVASMADSDRPVDKGGIELPTVFGIEDDDIESLSLASR